MKSLYAAVFSILSCVISSPSRADVKYYSLEKSPTPIEFARSLMGPNFKPATKMRGLRPVMLAGSEKQNQTVSATNQSTDFVQPSPQSAQPESVSPTSANALAVPIPFGFNSARLPEVAINSLDDIAEGIKLIHSSAPMRIVIEGHTDANGGAAYNMKLSQWRAAAVKRYLVSQHQIDPRLLVAKGYGHTLPFNKGNRFADENRRVQFRPS